MSPLDLAVVGGGVAGLAAADEAASLGLEVALFESGLYGGLVANVGALDGWPAVVSGSELAYGWKDRLAAAGVRFHEEHVEAVRAQGRRRIVETDRGRYRAKGRRRGDRREAPPAGCAGRGRTDRARRVAMRLLRRRLLQGCRRGRGWRRRCGLAGSAASRRLCAFGFHDRARRAAEGAAGLRRAGGGRSEVPLPLEQRSGLHRRGERRRGRDARRRTASGGLGRVRLHRSGTRRGAGGGGRVRRRRRPRSAGSLAEAVADGQRAAREAAAALRR